MISCRDFIPAYSALFRYLEDRGGTEAVDDFWRFLSDRFLGNLRGLVETHGLEGCWRYWEHTLNEEAAGFTMELDEQEGVFRITMHECPSKGRLLACEHVEPYHDYCRHCDVLYRWALAPLGYEVTCDLSRSGEAACSLMVRRVSGDDQPTP